VSTASSTTSCEGRKYKGCDALQPTRTATTSASGRAARSSADGPSPRPRSNSAASYLVDARDLDEAIAIAGRIPPAALGEHRGPPRWWEMPA